MLWLVSVHVVSEDVASYLGRHWHGSEMLDAIGQVTAVCLDNSVETLNNLTSDYLIYIVRLGAGCGLTKLRTWKELAGISSEVPGDSFERDPSRATSRTSQVVEPFGRASEWA